METSSVSLKIVVELDHSPLTEIWPVWYFLCLWWLLAPEYPKTSTLTAFLKNGKGRFHGWNS